MGAVVFVLDRMVHIKLLEFLSSVDFFENELFFKTISGILSENSLTPDQAQQRVNLLSGLILVLAVCKCCQQMAQAALVVKEFAYEPVHESSNNVVCATSKASDQPAHTCSLIRAFAI